MTELLARFQQSRVSEIDLVLQGLFCVATFTIYVVILVVAIARTRRNRALRAELADPRIPDSIASLFGGSVGADRAVRFVRNGHRWVLRRWIDAGTACPVTTLEIHVAADAFLDVIARSSPRRPRSAPRMKPVFENHAGFRIHSNDPVWAQRVLSGGLLERISALQGTTGVPVRVQLAPHRILVEAEMLADDGRALTLVEGADRIVESAAYQEIPGAVEVLEVSIRDGGICPVCGAAMEGRVVRCAACRTPHHGDCWDYLGRCSTFGCAGRKGR